MRSNDYAHDYITEVCWFIVISSFFCQMYVTIITCTAVVYFNEGFAMLHGISRKEFIEKAFMSQDLGSCNIKH